MIKTALGGLKVLEYAQFVSGPYCTKLLADLGAEVIKIEPPLVGDSARRREPFLDDIPGLERSGFFLFLNTSKLGITLDPDMATGREIFLRLVADCDVLIEDNPPLSMKGRGFDYESLSKINPHLIMTSITPFGQSGPYRDYKAYHLNTYHGSGVARVLSSILPKETPVPVKGPGFLGDFDAGLCAATATMAALYGRLLSGEGQHIDISKQEALMALERVEIGMYGNEGETKFSTVFMQQMMGGLQRCKDGYVLITLGGDHHWEGLLKLLGNPDWAQEEHFQGELGKYKHAQEINEHIADWIKDYTKDELYHRCQKLNCPIGMVTTVADLAASKQLEARGFFGDVEHPVMGKVKCPTAPYHFSETPHRFHHPAPMLGEHNEEIFVDRLGYSKEDIVRLREAGVI
ncbi:MAG: CoA transferase [Dehalococcoidia bacterium]|jgi:crotonobetainyl-CoA:carnitine CoA-transferase CaiB-like acyl-CoA transferase